MTGSPVTVTFRVLKIFRQPYCRWLARLRDALGRLTPIEYEMINTAQATLAASPDHAAVPTDPSR